LTVLSGDRQLPETWPALPKAEKIGRGNPKKIEPNDADTVHASLIEAEKKKEGKEGKRIIFQ